MQLMHPAIDRLHVHQTMKPIKVGIEAEEVGGVLQCDHPAAHRSFVEHDQAMLGQHGRYQPQHNTCSSEVDEAEDCFIAKSSPSKTVRLNFSGAEEAAKN